MLMLRCPQLRHTHARVRTTAAAAASSIVLLVSVVLIVIRHAGAVLVCVGLVVGHTATATTAMIHYSQDGAASTCARELQTSALIRLWCRVEACLARSYDGFVDSHISHTAGKLLFM